jgi:transcriptional regulator with XRE-family HTH domain
VDDIQLGRTVRLLRHRRGWRQVDPAHEAGVGRGDVSHLENGRARILRVEAVRRAVEALGARLRWDAGWRGPEFARLRDAGHAPLQNLTKVGLERLGWLVIAEASFNHFGERGRIDLLAFHPSTGSLLVIEIKTTIADIQELLGALDVKVRMARHVAVEQRWRPIAVVPCLVVAESATARRRIAAHAALFSRFALRGRPANAWIRRPAERVSGVLVFRFQSDAHPRGVSRTNRLRVRPSRAQTVSHPSPDASDSAIVPNQ